MTVIAVMPTKAAAKGNATTLGRNSAAVILFLEINIYAALVRPVVEATAVLMARTAVILVFSQVEHVITPPLKSVVKSLEAMTLYATSTKFAVMTDRVPRRAKKLITKHSAVRTIIRPA